MKIAVAQTKPVKGDIAANLNAHIKWTHMAAGRGGDMIIFPELSITGYEPTLAKELATSIDDSRFDVLQQLSDAKQIIIGAGMPINNEEGLTITMILFQPHQPRIQYSKQFLHADEIPFFVNAQPRQISLEQNNQMALAICYEISIPEHAANAHQQGAHTYIASVAKSVKGVEKALQELPDLARKYNMAVVMADCVGHCDDFDCGGKSSVWNNKGELLGQLNGTEEGLLIFDNKTQELVDFQLTS